MNNTTLLTNLTESTTLPEVKQAMVDTYTSELVQDIIYCGLLPVLTVLGTVGNILSVIVIGQESLKESTNILLLVLTLSDTIYLLTTGVRRAECIIGKFNPRLGHNYYMITLPQLKVVAIIFSRFTAAMTMLIAVERCITVIKPMKAKLWFAVKRVWITIFVIFIVVFALLFPTFLTMELKWKTFRNVSIAYVSLTDFYKSNIISLNWYLTIFLTILLRFIPVVSIIVSSVIIIIALKRSSSSPKVSPNALNEKITKVNKMMLTICIAYVLFNIPATVHQVLVFIYPEYNLNGSEKDLFQLISAIGQLTELVNSAWNFIVYFLLNDKFSYSLKRLLCGRCCPSLVQASASGQTAENYISENEVTETKEDKNARPI